MNKLTKYSPSSFLAMFCPKQNSPDSNHSLNDFVSISGLKPKISIATASFMVHLACSPSTQIAVDDKNQVTLILHGEIYNISGNKPEFLIEQFKKRGLAFSKDINGSFAVLLIDIRNDTIALITDRINTRKVFCSEYKGNYWLSTSLDLHPITGVDIDLIGVASYLANGVIHNDRTLLEGVRTLERACVHKLTEKGFHATKYWSFEFTDSYSPVDEKDLCHELSELLVDSVRIRLNDHPKVFLSLSAGYESTGILGILGSKLGVPNVDCFSYALGTPGINSDEHISKRMATYLGYDHKIVRSYKGDLANTIRLNALFGQGLANFCDEVDAWMELRQDFSGEGPSVLLVGDECFGRYRFQDNEFDCIADVLASVFIYDFEGLGWLCNMLDRNIYTTLNDRWHREILQIINRCPPEHGYDNIKDFLHLDQLLNYRFGPWREFFSGQFIVVRNPFLDNAILDFMMKVPSSLRLGKRLYIKTITHMFPDLFRFERARAPSYVPNWEQEFISQRHAIESLVASKESQLDRIIPPEVVIQLLRQNRTGKETVLDPQGLSIKTLRWLLRGHPIGRRILRLCPNISGRVIGRTTFLKRILVIRSFLEKNESKVLDS